MKQRVHHAIRVFMATTLAAFAFVSVQAAPLSYVGDKAHKDILDKVQALYGLDEEAALRRLAAEAEAVDVYRSVADGNVSGYAGAWFDPQSLKLAVAVNDPKGFEQAALLGARPVLVEHSLEELEAALLRVTALALPKGALRSAHVDVESNRVVLAVSPGHAQKARARVAEDAAKDAARITVVESDENVQLTANIRGADGTRNATWATVYGGVWPCSIGASHEIGYYTAGHCGEAGNVIRTPAGILIGTVTHSSFFSGNKDIATVTAAVGQIPREFVNGYSDGQITVPAKWAGISRAPPNSTVCRYGQTSGGPFCGTVNTFNMTITVSGRQLVGITRVSGSCANAGDSGGPWLSAATFQLQGTQIGATVVGTCAVPTTYSYFQPVADHIGAYSHKVLTAHGANVPSIAGLNCPDASMSGMGRWYCNFSHWNSQGAVTINWSAGSPWPVASTTGLQVRGNCSGGTVNVTLTVTNSYGAAATPRSFSCPLGPIP